MKRSKFGGCAPCRSLRSERVAQFASQPVASASYHCRTVEASWESSEHLPQHAAYAVSAMSHWFSVAAACARAATTSAGSLGELGNIWRQCAPAARRGGKQQHDKAWHGGKAGVQRAVGCATGTARFHQPSNAPVGMTIALLAGFVFSSGRMDSACLRLRAAERRRGRGWWQRHSSTSGQAALPSH